MSRMDWIPVYEWGIRQTVPAVAQLDQPLMDPTRYSGADVIGRFEESAGRYFVHRIVGVVTFDWVGTPSGGNIGLIQEVIWPGIIDNPTTGSVISPGFVSSGDAINSRLWFHRVKANSQSGIFTDITEDSSKWFSHIDIRPNQVIDDGQIPMYSVYNDDGGAIDLDYRMYARMLCTPLG